MGAGLIDPPRLSSGMARGAFKKTMRNAPTVGSDQFVEELILTVRGRRVILAGDLAGIYGADGRVALRSQNETLKRGQHVPRFRGYRPNSLARSSSRVKPCCAATSPRIAESVPIRSGSCAGMVMWCCLGRSQVSRIWLPVCRVT